MSSIKAGKYISRASVWGLSETKNGAEQFAIEFPITDAEGETHTLTYFGSFTEKAEAFTLKALRACGWVGNDLSKVTDLPNEVQLVVENEEYEGEWRTKIKWVNAIGGAIKHLDEGKAKSFAERMKGRVAAFDAKNATGAPKPGNGSPPRQQQQQQRQSNNDDDLPF